MLTFAMHGANHNVPPPTHLERIMMCTVRLRPWNHDVYLYQLQFPSDNAMSARIIIRTIGAVTFLPISRKSAIDQRLPSYVLISHKSPSFLIMG